MKTVVIILCLFFVSGCATVHVKTENCEATYSTVLKDLEAANFSICGGSAEVLESNNNTKVLESVLGILSK